MIVARDGLVWWRWFDVPADLAAPVTPAATLGQLLALNRSV
jgi:hypothetical protein